MATPRSLPGALAGLRKLPAEVLRKIPVALAPRDCASLFYADLMNIAPQIELEASAAFFALNAPRVKTFKAADAHLAGITALPESLQGVPLCALAKQITLLQGPDQFDQQLKACHSILDAMLTLPVKYRDGVPEAIAAQLEMLTNKVDQPENFYNTLDAIKKLPSEYREWSLAKLGSRIVGVIGLISVSGGTAIPEAQQAVIDAFLTAAEECPEPWHSTLDKWVDAAKGGLDGLLLMVGTAVLEMQQAAQFANDINVFEAEHNLVNFWNPPMGRTD